YIGVGFDVHEKKLAEEMIQYHTTLLEAHNEASVDGILLVDAKGKILSYNKRFTEIWNMPQEIVDAKDDEAALAFAMTQLVNPQQFIEKVKWMYAHPTETTLDELEYKDGKIVERHGFPVVGEDGTYYAWSWTFRDVSEKKMQERKIKESEAHFRQMSDLMPAKISNAGINGNVLYFNNKWLDFTGLNFEELKDFGYHKILHPDELEEFQKRFQEAAETGTDLEMEMRFINKDGEYKWHLNRASPMKDENGNIKMWIGVTSEIQKIKDEEERKDNFVKMISHELKTPVTSIKGYIQILLMMLEGEKEIHNTLQVKNSLVRVDKMVSRLTRLITEMLDLTRIDESKLLLQNKLFNLNELVNETVEDIRYTNTKNPIVIYDDFTCNINADRDRIGQIIINFIGNAIKYSPNNDIIEVRIRNYGKNKVAVSVKDYGIGINKKDHEKIFERFYRVEGKEEKTFSGFGIGLFIAKSIIERHNGSITIESEKGKGSIFTFILPMAVAN
ncbi:MAG: PAS domain-containing sensor histidine kinase, partial [Chitinophagaceae bacterium]|nr:PAS domain-containing sensor histidine kinase [Chitinophagaceae bacterium]